MIENKIWRGEREGDLKQAKQGLRIRSAGLNRRYKKVERDCSAIVSMGRRRSH